jgi:hypothetical protein
MAEVNYGSKHESPVQLQKSGDLIAVRTRSRRPLRAGPVQPAAAAEVSDGQLVLAFPDAGVEVYRVPPAAPQRSLEQRKQALRRDLQLTLVPPAGRSLPSVLLHDRSGGSKNNIRRSFDTVSTPGLAAFRGVDPSGSWTLRVSDEVEQDSGTLVEFGLEFSFEAAPVVRAPRATAPLIAPVANPAE